jgi:hypothetical protein
VWKQELETDGLAKAFADNGEEQLDPSHKTVKKAFALGMDFVHEIIERLFVSLYEVDEGLDCPMWIFLTNCIAKFVNNA